MTTEQFNSCDGCGETKNEIRHLPMVGHNNLLLCQQCYYKEFSNNNTDLLWKNLTIYSTKQDNRIKIISLDEKTVIGTGKNLRVILDYARKSKIMYINIHKNWDYSGRVYIEFYNGYVETDFNSYEILKNWLKSRRNWKGVNVYDYFASWQFTI